MSETPFRGIKLAQFKPKNIDTLRPAFRKIIGDVISVYFGWMMDDDDPYPGQIAYIIYDPNNDLGIDGHLMWIPEEDLDFNVLTPYNCGGIHE